MCFCVIYPSRSRRGSRNKRAFYSWMPNCRVYCLFNSQSSLWMCLHEPNAPTCRKGCLSARSACFIYPFPLLPGKGINGFASVLFELEERLWLRLCLPRCVFCASAPLFSVTFRLVCSLVELASFQLSRSPNFLLIPACCMSFTLHHGFPISSFIPVSFISFPPDHYFFLSFPAAATTP